MAHALAHTFLDHCGWRSHAFNGDKLVDPVRVRAVYEDGPAQRVADDGNRRHLL